MSNKEKYSSKGWSFICHELELSKENAFVNINFYEGEIFAFKEKNKIKVYDNFCNHRGCRLVDGKFGFWNKGCPYHGLKYENGAPINTKELGLESSKKRLQLKSYKIEKVGGLIFFAENEYKISLKDYLGLKTFNHLEKISASLDSIISDDSYIYNCRLEVAIENALEPLHLESVHPNSLNELKLGEAENSFSDNTITFTQDIRNEKMKKGLVRLKKLFKYNFDEKYQSTFVFPSFFISSTFGFSFSIQTFYPSSDKFKTYFRSKIYSSKLSDSSKSEILSSFFKSSISLNKQIFNEDNEICSRVAKKETHYHGPLAQTEEKLIWYRKKLK